MKIRQPRYQQLKIIWLALFSCLVSLCLMFTSKSVVYAADPAMENIDFKAVDPLQLGGNINAVDKATPSDVDLSTPGKIISRALTYAFPIAGTILFVMILWGGFEMISGATESKSMEAGKQRITAAVVGFLLLFAAYWMTQLVQIVFNISILG